MQIENGLIIQVNVTGGNSLITQSIIFIVRK
jgi:hypothetical protein